MGGWGVSVGVVIFLVEKSGEGQAVELWQRNFRILGEDYNIGSLAICCSIV